MPDFRTVTPFLGQLGLAPLVNIYRLAAALGVSPDELLNVPKS